MKFYRIDYKVTETCQNGNERRIKKSVYIRAERDGHAIIDFNRNEKAYNMLKARHYYDIEWIDDKIVDLMITID